jgi:RimJ/RimL family protein N-acetyltransferase
VVFSIISKEDDKAIGYVSIKGMSSDSSDAEVGIAILNKKYRSRGYGTEALWKAAVYAFTELGIDLLYLTVFPYNNRAIRTYEKLGFRRVKLLKKAWMLPEGDCSDMLLMKLNKDNLLNYN